MPRDAAKEEGIGGASSRAMLRSIRLAGFRCFEALQYEPGPTLSFITGPNAQGKTSILEAACLLLRMRSPRTTSMGELVRFGGTAFALEGIHGETRLSIICTPPARSLKLDGVPQTSSREYLSQGQIVWFGSEDLSLVNGSAERRRKLLDSVGLQLQEQEGTLAPNYGRDLKNYDKALRSRNLLLREGRPRREIEAYDIPLADAGDRITGSRQRLVAAIAPLAATSCHGISGEVLSLSYLPGADLPLLEALKESRGEEIRLRQTRVGPQRDDVGLMLNGIPAGSFASEGQRRTIAVAIKLAAARLLARENTMAPLLLLDDIFGELDPERRDALLAGMPRGSQALLSTADLTGITLPAGSLVHRLGDGLLTPAQ